jgi:Uma2 family endonuclease
MPMLADRYWTSEQVRALPDDGRRHECIDGALIVTPAPSFDHQYVIQALYEELKGIAAQAPLGVLMFSPADIEIVPDTMVQPDLFIAQPKAGVHRIRSWKHIERLSLAVEVISPSTARIDRGLKRRFYQTSPVGEYWIVDPFDRVVERWLPGRTAAEVVAERLCWTPVPGHTLEIDLRRLFAEALD